MSGPVLIYRVKAEEVTSFATAEECVTVEAAERLVQIWRNKLAKLPPGQTERGKYAKACRVQLHAAVARVISLGGTNG